MSVQRLKITVSFHAIATLFGAAFLKAEKNGNHPDLIKWARSNGMAWENHLMTKGYDQDEMVDKLGEEVDTKVTIEIPVSIYIHAAAILVSVAHDQLNDEKDSNVLGQALFDVGNAISKALGATDNFDGVEIPDSLGDELD